jgi:hypothetical protein
MPHGVRSTYSNITRTRLRATQGAANVVENHGRITGYSTGIGLLLAHRGRTNDDLAALMVQRTASTVRDCSFRCATPSCCVGVWNEGYGWYTR